MAPTRSHNLIAAAAAVLLSACAAGAPVERAPPAVAPAVTTTPSPPATPEPGRTPVREPVRAAAPADPIPETLLGLTSEAVDKLLGKPEIVLREGTAEVRLYRNAEAKCTLHVFLYQTADSGRTSTVDFFEARNGGGRLAEAEAVACFRGLVKRAAS